MRTFDKVAALLATVALPSVAVADNHSHSGHDMHSGHHQATNTMEPAAEAGQVIIVYHWPCADRESGLAILKSMIAYERTASPYPYSAAPAIHQDGALVSVDVHPSTESMEQAVAWQNTDAQWQSLFNDMVGVCGSADDLTQTLLMAQ